MWRVFVRPRVIASVAAPVLALSQAKTSPSSQAQIVRPLRDEEMDRDLYDKTKFFLTTLGVIPNSVKTMAHRTKVANAFTELNMACMKCDGDLTYEFKRLLGYVTSFAQGCNY